MSKVLHVMEFNYFHTSPKTMVRRGKDKLPLCLIKHRIMKTYSLLN